MIYNYITLYTLLSYTIIIFVIKLKHNNMAAKDKDKRTVTIRRSVNKVNDSSTTQQPEEQQSSLNRKGIILASATQETDPFKIELNQKGYSILSENEYGVTVRKTLGKPTFMPRTRNGYFEEEKPNNVRLPESINTAMKMRVAGMRINSQQYITQLIMKDLRENDLL